MSNEILGKLFDAVVKNENDDVTSEIFSQYIETKAKEVIKGLVSEAEKPVRLKGNDVHVQGKKVGSISHDKDKDEGIEYTSDADGKKSKHESLEKLFAFLTKEHKLNEGKDDLHVLSTRKKGTEKWHPQFSGSKSECKQEWSDTKHDWVGHESKVHPHDEKVNDSNEQAESD